MFYRKKYNFLSEILNKYDTFDNPVSNKDVNVDILNLCDEYKTFNSNLTPEQKDTCKKLLRNLFLCNDTKKVNPIKCCSALNFWLYFEIKKYSFSKDIIEMIYDLPYGRENNVANYGYCPPYNLSNDNLDKTEELLKLSIFIVNIDEFQNLLNSYTDNFKKCFLKKYFYECVNTYNVLKEQYCSEE
ncbi:hypothetical protein PCYB_006340 [Plasmodium cynomolgi strain B]|uniref:CYIR protein n=1 Tax=Plasmodium cynomolgi (strain B) TaxID=1120755 RepID=K6V3E3_PLACD|nr:hypothetical protein PCYB_006340 [Plasmodium cynomolgi strain B]GAB69885.1 hypothetical protein PCYB_006340 [Plasmodium cynomolgi strain B]